MWSTDIIYFWDTHTANMECMWTYHSNGLDSIPWYTPTGEYKVNIKQPCARNVVNTSSALTDTNCTFAGNQNFWIPKQKIDSKVNSNKSIYRSSRQCTTQRPCCVSQVTSAWLDRIYKLLHNRNVLELNCLSGLKDAILEKSIGNYRHCQ